MKFSKLLQNIHFQMIYPFSPYNKMQNEHQPLMFLPYHTFEQAC